MRQTLTIFLLAAAMTATAQIKTEIKTMNQAGPYAVGTPLALDTVDVKGQKFDENSLMSSIALTSPVTGRFEGHVLPSLTDSKSVGLLSFYVNNRDYLKGKIEVKGPKHYKLYVDGHPATPELKLAPDHHTFTIQYLAEPKDTDSIRVTIDAPKAVAYTLDAKHPFMVHDITDGKRVRDISISPDGQYLKEVKTARTVMLPQRQARWLPKTIAWIEEEREGRKRVLYQVKPTGERTRWISGLPEGGYTVAPTEDYLVMTIEEKGPEEDKEMFEVLEMDDRQPGWRNRNYLARYDVATGLTRRITFGHQQTMLMDISQDGRKLLVAQSYSRLAKRPTEVMDVMVVNAETFKADTLFTAAGFLANASFSPDGRQILFKGSPEAFDRIGCTLPADVTPNMYDYQLYLYDIASKQVKPLTCDFNPSVQTIDWAWGDGLVYFTAEDRDFVRLYQMNPYNGQIVQLEHAGDNVTRMNVSAHANIVGYISNGVSEYASAFAAYTAKGKAPMKQVRLYDGRSIMDDIAQGLELCEREGRDGLRPDVSAAGLRCYEEIPDDRVLLWWLFAREPLFRRRLLRSLLGLARLCGLYPSAQRCLGLQSGVGLASCEHGGTRSGGGYHRGREAYLCRASVYRCEEGGLHGCQLRRIHDDVPADADGYLRRRHLARRHCQPHELLG